MFLFPFAALKPIKERVGLSGATQPGKKVDSDVWKYIDSFIFHIAL